MENVALVAGIYLLGVGCAGPIHPYLLLPAGPLSIYPGLRRSFRMPSPRTDYGLRFQMWNGQLLSSEAFFLVNDSILLFL